MTLGSASALPAIGIPGVDLGRQLHLPSARPEELMEAYVDGDADSFDELYRRLAPN